MGCPRSATSCSAGSAAASRSPEEAPVDPSPAPVGRRPPAASPEASLSPEHPPARRLARRPAARGCNPRAYLAELHDRGGAPARASTAGGPRRASGAASPVSRARLAGEPTAQGSSPASGGPPASGRETALGLDGRSFRRRTKRRALTAGSGGGSMRPGETRQSLTERVAASFASVAQARCESAVTTRRRSAHFVNRLVFCMFAADIGLLPDHMFTRMLRHALPAPARFGELAS